MKENGRMSWTNEWVGLVKKAVDGFRCFNVFL
jgi:hypothetical protein